MTLRGRTLWVALAWFGFANATNHGAIVHGLWPANGDLNLDGVSDFTLYWEHIATTDIPVSNSSHEFGVRPSGNFYAAVGNFALALDAGSEIGPESADFTWINRRRTTLAVYTVDSPQSSEPVISDWLGPVAGRTESFFGLRFVAADGEHFAWLRIHTDDSTDVRILKVVDYAWETTPNAAITAGVPEPGTLSLLLGASGILLRRRRSY
jgi:hypothetical protein